MLSSDGELERHWSESWRRHKGVVCHMLHRLGVSRRAEAWHIAKIALWQAVREVGDCPHLTTVLWRRLVSLINQWKLETEAPFVVSERRIRSGQDYRRYFPADWRVSLQDIQQEHADENRELYNVLTRLLSSPEPGYDEVEQQMQREWFWSEVCAVLDSRSFQVLMLRYRGEDMTPRHVVAAQLQLSPTRVFQIEQEAIDRLRHHFQQKVDAGVVLDLLP